MTDDRDFLTEEEASRLWSRAAQLQAEAAHRAERALGPGERPAGGDEAPGYALQHVLAAAAEAGIGPEFLESALSDLRAEKAIARNQERRAWLGSRAVLGNPPDAVTVRRVVAADPRGVLSAMEAVMPVEPYKLTLRDRIGDPAKGGALLFDIEGASFAAAGGSGFVGAASWADFRQVVATVTPARVRPPATELVLRAPVAWAMNLNAGFGAAFTGVATGLGGVLGLAIASGVGALATGGVGVALTGILALGGAAGGGAGSLKAYRALYRYSLRRGESGLVGLLAAVAAQAEGGWGFATPGAPALPEPEAE